MVGHTFYANKRAVIAVYTSMLKALCCPIVGTT